MEPEGSSEPAESSPHLHTIPLTSRSGRCLFSLTRICNVLPSMNFTDKHCTHNILYWRGGGETQRYCMFTRCGIIVGVWEGGGERGIACPPTLDFRHYWYSEADAFWLPCLFTVPLRGSADGWGGMLQAEMSKVRVPMWSLDFFVQLPNPSNRNMALGFSQPLTKMSTRKYFLGVRCGRRVRLTT
jgi:hypothetical protein